MRGIVVLLGIGLSAVACRAPAASHSLRPFEAPRIETRAQTPPPETHAASASMRPASPTAERWPRRELELGGRHLVLDTNTIPVVDWTEGPAVASASRTRLAVDFGVGDPRYDDGVRSLEPLPAASPGFSDSVLQLGVSGRLGRGASWTSGFAAIRHQDEPFLDDLDQTEVGWVTVGVQLEF